MKLTTLMVPFGIMTLLTGFGKHAAPAENGPAKGSTKTITVDIEYYSGNIEGSSSVATWPIAKFAVEQNAISYRVKEIKTGKTYSWENGEETQAAYHVFPASQDIKDGMYYIALGRTWSAESAIANPAWKANYINNYAEENEVEITFYY